MAETEGLYEIMERLKNIPPELMDDELIYQEVRKYFVRLFGFLYHHPVQMVSSTIKLTACRILNKMARILKSIINLVCPHSRNKSDKQDSLFFLVVLIKLRNTYSVKYVKSSAGNYYSPQYSVFQLVTSLQNILGKKTTSL